MEIILKSIENFQNLPRLIDNRYVWAVTFMVVSTVVPLLIIFWCFAGFSQPNEKLDTVDTFSLSFIATLLPFVFAAITYSKSKLADVVAEIVVERVMPVRERCIWFYFAIQLLLASSLPFVTLIGVNKSSLQVLLVFLEALTTLLAISGLLHLAKFEVVLDEYGNIELSRLRKTYKTDIKSKTKRLKRLFGPEVSSQILEVPQVFEERLKLSIEPLLALIRKNIELNRLREIQITLRALESIICAYYQLRRDIQSVGSDNVTLFVVSELNKLISVTSTQANEKNLDSFRGPIRTMSTAACELRSSSNWTNSLIHPWEDLCAEVSIRTSALENTNLPIAMLDSLGVIGVTAIESGHCVSVAFGSLENFTKLIDYYSQRESWWFQHLRSQAIINLIRLMPAYVSNYKNVPPVDYFTERWAKAINIAALRCSNTYKKNIAFHDPLYVFTDVQVNIEALVPQYLIVSASLEVEIKRQAQSTSGNVSEELIENRRKLLLIPRTIASFFTEPLLSERVWGDIALAFSGSFFVDFVASNSVGCYSPRWRVEMTEMYTGEIQHLVKLVKQFENNLCSDSDFWKNIFCIPALTLTYSASGSGLVEKLIPGFVCLLLSAHKLTKKEDRRGLSIIESYMRLLAAWLFITDLLPQKRKVLERKITKLQGARHEYFPRPLEAAGFPSGVIGEVWSLTPTKVWGVQVQMDVSSKLVEPDRLLAYAKFMQGLEGE